MQKAVKLMCLALCAGMLLCACSPSPTAVKVGSRAIDASEVAFYMNYVKLDYESQHTDVQYTDELTVQLKEKVLDQLVNAELIRQKCNELKLELTDQEKDYISSMKRSLIESLGGKAAYLEYLNASALTDRMYEQVQEDTFYYDKLYDYVIGENSASLGNDEVMRKFFADNYLKVKYIRFSTLDEFGEKLDENETDNIYIKATEIFSLLQQTPKELDTYIEQYNDDPTMTDAPDGIIINIHDVSGSTYLEGAVNAPLNEIHGVYTASDGFYIVYAESVSASDYEQNQSIVYQNASDMYFSDSMNLWKEQTKIKTTGAFDEITFENYIDYIK